MRTQKFILLAATAAWALQAGSAFAQEKAATESKTDTIAVAAAAPATDLTDILYHRHRETIASAPPDPEVVGLG